MFAQAIDYSHNINTTDSPSIFNNELKNDSKYRIQNTESEEVLSDPHRQIMII
jgi:hypothetical protein